MSAKVQLEVIEGKMKGKSFVFDEHDTFIFGRLSDCHACLPDDPQVSRHHFIMEANPPDARVRDLGSLNGTHVNERKIGAREKDETPEEAAKRKYPEVDLKDGDLIKVGQTVMRVHVEVPAICCECNKSIPDAERDKCVWIGGTFICAPCKARLAASVEPRKAPEPVRCQKCGKDVGQEIGQGRRGDYICEACRGKVEVDPAEFLAQLLRQAIKGRPGEAVPTIEGYEIEKKLGQGGMGAVYLARRKSDRKHCAIKVMLADVAVTEQARERFKREMVVQNTLRHPHIVEFLDDGSVGTAFYFIMELCDGGGVDGFMRRQGGKIPLGLASPIMLQVLDGLSFAHEKGVIHRDLKPPNILLSGSGGNLSAKISDFGLAKNFQQAGLTRRGTVTGETAGTPVFMPRDQITNFKYIKPSGDVWSIAATFYNMLTGQYPRNFQRGRDMIAIVLSEPVVPIRTRDATIPRNVAEVIDHALAEKPGDRYQTAAEMRKALESAL